ncbi:MAG TPA: hypothetical protein VFB42_13830 [Gaiellaceae bacterium]|nr:hypothetical protein [Gaiellaceae bacterium]
MKHRFLALLLGLAAVGLAAAGGALADKPEIDPTYAGGQTVSMIGPHLLVDARRTSPNLYAQSEELYLLSYPAGTGGPITLPSGYRPQCNPCFHPGLPAPFVYHDHVITGAPGRGANGTAGEFKGPWKIIVLAYDPVYAESPSFTPITNADDIPAAEAAGVFLPINADHAAGANPYEVDTGNVLICPVVSDHA